ncbi:MAG: hypothetical protein F4X77_18215 [Acidobacteriia bacterium]|nr:hypothetical protein [Terriglobia bacterium]
MGLRIGTPVEAGGGYSLTADETAQVVRDQLRPHFSELAQCGSTPELLGHRLYRQIQPIADRVLATTENGAFATPDAPAKSSYRLLAWNIERGIEFEAQMEEFREHDYLRSADVLLLTETDVGMARSGNRNIARDLARELGLNYAFAPCYLNLSKGAGVESESAGENAVGLHGNALLSRYPLRNPRRIALGNGRDKMRGREKRLGQQAAIAAEVDLPGLPLTACSVHLDAQSRQRHRRDQMELVIEGLPPDGPAVIAGDWNTTTFDSSSARSVIIGYFVRLMFGVNNMIKGHFLRPYALFERDLFRLLERRGFDWRASNVLDERTTSYDVEDAKTHKNLREWVPEWCFDFVRWALRDFDGKCPLKIDWFATRGLSPKDPIVLHEFREDRVAPLSDHDVIGLDLPVPARTAR